MGDISVILNVYKRGYTLEKQIEAIKQQSIGIKSENIHVWYNKVEGVVQPLPKDPEIKTYQCNYNTKFFGRFTIPLLCRTKYIAIFDDDIIPSKDWFSNCLNSMNKLEGIYGGSGIITNGKTYTPHQKVGWNGLKSDKITEVDLVGHAWFFKQEHTKFMWTEPIPSWDNGEDIFFSYVAQKYGIKTYVPPHPEGHINLWSNDRALASNNGVDWGSDENAHYIKNVNHMDDRNKLVEDMISNGWKTVK
jgi:hypothetical protein